MPDYLVALLGVVTGFVLSEAATILRSWLRNKRYKNALEDELKTNLYQLAQKEDIAQQMSNELDQGTFLPGLSVPFASTVYEAHFPPIIHLFTSVERDNIRHIYSNLMTLDHVMGDMEGSYKQDVQSGVMKDVNSAYKSRIDDVLKNYSVLKNLISSFLEGNPVDIYYRNTQIT